MKTIWKYKVPTGKQEFTLHLPTHRKILSFQCQDNIPTIWVLIDPDTLLESVGFHLYGTGCELGYFGNYIGTVLQHEGSLVWHLFED